DMEILKAIENNQTKILEKTSLGMKCGKLNPIFLSKTPGAKRQCSHNSLKLELEILIVHLNSSGF
ncbi:17676_t:CDS:2, partial [Dentiscutata erythropus]